MSLAADILSQEQYHRHLFSELFDWNKFWGATLQLVDDDATLAANLALDQLGHFGAHGVVLAGERLSRAVKGPLNCVVELGSGFGGSLRHLGKELAARGAHPNLIGIEFVNRHCKLARQIGQVTGATGSSFVQADVANVPLAEASVDAVFAAGSASHFARVEAVFAECHRVLRSGGVLVMLEEVSLRPEGVPSPGERFLHYHPPEVFHAETPARRRTQLEASGLEIEVFENLTEWAIALLRERVRVLQFLGACAIRMYSREAYERILGTLSSAAEEYERKTVTPALIVCRRS
jgi:ubiquinone/menaquinone biosynthesis C-methylase UbiE